MKSPPERSMGASLKSPEKGPFFISAVNQACIGSNPVCGAKYFPLRNSPHSRLTASCHISTEIANTRGNLPLAKREGRGRQKGRNGSPVSGGGQPLTLSELPCALG